MYGTLQAFKENQKSHLSQTGGWKIDLDTVLAPRLDWFTFLALCTF